MKRLVIVLIVAVTPMWSAERPKRRQRSARVVVVKPYFDPKWEAANLAGGVIGNLIGQWMMRSRGPSAFDNWNIQGDTPTQDTFVAPYREPVPDPVAELTVESNQPESEVLADAKPVGFAPLLLRLPSGTRYVVVRRAGFRDWTREVETLPGDALTVSAELKPIPEEVFVITVQPTRKQP